MLHLSQVCGKVRWTVVIGFPTCICFEAFSLLENACVVCNSNRLSIRNIYIWNIYVNDGSGILFAAVSAGFQGSIKEERTGPLSLSLNLMSSAGLRDLTLGRVLSREVK